MAEIRARWRKLVGGDTPILDDAPQNHITLFDLAVDPPALWDEQRERIGMPS